MKSLVSFFGLASAYSSLDEYQEEWNLGSSLKANASAEYITLKNGGAVWQLLTAREGGVAFTGYVQVGKIPLPTVIDTGSTSMICLSCKCPTCAGSKSSLYSACHGGDHAVKKRDCFENNGCRSRSKDYVPLKDDLTFSYVSGSTQAKAAKERIEVKGHNHRDRASVIGEDATFYEITRNALDVIKLGFFSCVMGVAAGCQHGDCNKKCDGGCQEVFLHQFDNAGNRYSICLEGSKGWMVWNDQRRPGAVEVKLLEYENSPGDLISQLWYTPLRKVSIGNHVSDYCQTNSCIAVFDSGTSLFMFPHAFEREVSRSVADIIRAYRYNCQAVWKQAPHLSLTVGGGNTISVSPASYIGEVDASDFLRAITSDILQGSVHLPGDMKKRLSWLFKMRGSHPLLTEDKSGVFQRLKCLIGQCPTSLKRSGSQMLSMSQAQAMKIELDSVADRAWHMCGVQVMTSTEEYPHEFILGIPFFREYMVTFEMPLVDPRNSRSRSDFHDRKVFLAKHNSDCGFPDRPVDDVVSLKQTEEVTVARPKLTSMVFPRTFQKIAHSQHEDTHHHHKQHKHSKFHAAAHGHSHSHDLP